MPIYYYRARDKNGVLVTGEIEAPSAQELKEALFREGCVPLAVEAVRKGRLSLRLILNLFDRVKAEELMVFTRQFHTLFKAGVSMDTILATAAKQTRSGTLRNALVRIRADISAGSSLGQAFGRHPRIFNELYCSMLTAGEEAGILENVLSNLAALLVKEFEIQKNIKSATLYPKIVIFVLVVAIVFLMTYVVPKFVEFYSRYGAELPLATQVLIAISNFFRYYWYVLLGSVFALVFFFHRFYASHIGRLKLDRLRFHLPVFGNLNLKVANSRFGHILAALYRAGLPMPRSLEVVANVIGNVAFAIEVHKVRDAIQRGSTLSEAMARQLYFSPVMIETTAVGERSGAIDEMLSAIAEHYDLEVHHTVKNLTTLLEPLLLVGIFGMVGLLAMAIFMPIWNLSTVVGEH